MPGEARPEPWLGLMAVTEGEEGETPRYSLVKVPPGYEEPGPEHEYLADVDRLEDAFLYAAAPLLFKVAQAPGLNEAHDALAAVLNDGKATPEAVRAAAVELCLALVDQWASRKSALEKAVGERPGWREMGGEPEAAAPEPETRKKKAAPAQGDLFGASEPQQEPEEEAADAETSAQEAEDNG